MHLRDKIFVHAQLQLFDDTMNLNNLILFPIQGCNGKRFEGNLVMWIKMLLPSADKRIYNLQSRQLIKLFARILDADQADMLTDLELGKCSVLLAT